MSPAPPSETPEAPAALSAFLRGIERRGVVFAELHCGDAAVGEQALAIGLRMFRSHALAHPFAQWPQLFWRALLAAPPLRTGAASPRWAPQFAVIGAAGTGPRTALLLRLVAGLADADAAAVLGIAQPTYRLALQRALPHLADGDPDVQAWRALGTATQQAIQALPAERLAHLARLREAAVQGRRPELIGPFPADVPAAASLGKPHPLLRGVLWAGVVACVAGLAATFLLPLVWQAKDGDARVHVRALGSAARPAATYDASTALLTEPDFEQLLAPQAQELPEHMDFYAWYAAERVRPRSARTARQAPAQDISETPESTDAPETSNVPR